MPKSVEDMVVIGESPFEVEDYLPAAEKILGGNPQQRVENYYTDPTGVFSTGVWYSEHGEVRITYTEEEFCHILSGVVELRDDSGATRRFTAGDNFVIPAGFEGVWATIKKASKIYVIYEKD